MKKTFRYLLPMLLCLTILSGCSAPTPEPTATPQPTNTAIPATETPTVTPSPIPPSPTPIRTPPALPGTFQSSMLNPLDSPHTYVSDTCQYIKNRWDPNKSSPGTVVMIIMLHGVADNGTTNIADNGITHGDLKRIMEHLAETRFQTIDTAQLADFLYNNGKIPQRSVMFLVDDRHWAEYYTKHFVPFFENHGWTTVTNAWISDESLGLPIYTEMEQLASSGFLDVQAHGFVHNINITESSSDDYIHQELYNSIEVITRHFGRAPIAYIWPGGSFTARGIQAAREAGYQLGFTVNPRGPVMYNWIPQTDQKDPNRPSYLAEGPLNDPLMTLPRYWSTDAYYRIDEVINIGDSASRAAGETQQTELLYYDIVCKDTYGAIPEAATTP